MEQRYLESFQKNASFELNEEQQDLVQDLQSQMAVLIHSREHLQQSLM